MKIINTLLLGLVFSLVGTADATADTKDTVTLCKIEVPSLNVFTSALASDSLDKFREDVKIESDYLARIGETERVFQIIRTCKYGPTGQHDIAIIRNNSGRVTAMIFPL